MDSVRCRTAERFPTRKQSFRFPGMSGTNTERYRTINHSNLLFEIVGWAVRAAHCYIYGQKGEIQIGHTRQKRERVLKTFVHHTSYGCMDWFTNAKQANIRRETYTSQLMKGGHFTMNLPLFISSANFLLMKSLLLVLFRGLCSLLRLTAQQKIN